MSRHLLVKVHQELLFDDLPDDGVAAIGKKIARALRPRFSASSCRSPLIPGEDQIHEQDEGNAQTETARFDDKKPRTGRFHDGNRLPVLLNGGAHLTRTANKSASFGTSAWLHDDCLEARL